MVENEDIQLTSEFHKCFICEKSFSSASNLNRHIRRIHNCETIVPGTLSCGLCNEDFPTTEKLQDHLIEGHQIDIEIEYHAFASVEEFQRWKEDEETITSSKYVKHRGTEIGSDGEVATFFCHRSGKASLVGKESRRRSIKMQGSNKIGCHCPSKITTMRVYPDCIEVEYIKTHVGHTTDIKRVPLANSERHAIALKLREKLNVDSVLEDLKTTSNGDKLDRIHLLTRQDLKNIARDFKVSKDGVFHGNDTMTLEEWVKSMEDNDENPVRWFKRQGELSDDYPSLGIDDFLLVIMTRTQREILLNNTDAVIVDITDTGDDEDYELITLLVIDEKKEGFPCCFVLTNRIDEIALKIAFEIIHQITGPLSPTVFMSEDEMEETFLAWKSVFNFSGDRLLCNWHVKRAWERNRDYIKGSDQLKNEVFDKLQILMEEPDKKTFQSMLVRVCRELLEKEETSAFGGYFSAHFVNRPEMWAHCYRPTAGIHTRMNLDDIHSAVGKYDSVNQKTIKRLDKTVHSLMRYLYQYKRFDSNKTKDAVARKTKLNQQRHTRSLKLSEDSIFFIEEGQWDVLALGTNNGEVYRVQKLNPCTTECPLYCPDCNSCAHNFSCTCADYSERGNMCEHVHLVARSQVTVATVVTEVCESEEMTSVTLNGEFLEFGQHIVLEEGFKVEPEEINEDSSETIEDLEPHKASVMKELQCMIEGSVASCRSEMEIKQFLEYFQQCNENWITTRAVEGDEPKQIYLLISQ